jgi:hypothetical protein
MSNDTWIAEVMSSDATALCALLARILQRCIAEQDAQIMALLSLPSTSETQKSEAKYEPAA